MLQIHLNIILRYRVRAAQSEPCDELAQASDNDPAITNQVDEPARPIASETSRSDRVYDALHLDTALSLVGFTIRASATTGNPPRRQRNANDLRTS